LCRCIGNIGHCRKGRKNLGHWNPGANQCSRGFNYHRDRDILWEISKLRCYLLVDVGNSQADNNSSGNRVIRMFFNQYT
jgi:hypothetical protein